MLWHRTQDRGSSPLPTHSEYFNFKQHAARLTKKREQGMFIDRCSGTRGIWLQRGVRYPLAISLRLPLSHPNVSLMCAYVYVYMYMCLPRNKNIFNHNTRRAFLIARQFESPRPNPPADQHIRRLTLVSVSHRYN
ncbi:hypothetical protein ALC53_04785 [Atta colombica]|uniref:Uncharacterized protein n=1 Tax=Atta colombica TaxID=520822 RepID=A0A195BJX2_9HYME|nr:hypothetical protein ALC53_04785 [Atta colombica]